MIRRTYLLVRYLDSLVAVMIKNKNQDDVATINVTYEDGVVTIAVQGRVTTAVGDEIMRRGVEAMRQHDARRMLHDFRRARLVEPTLRLIKRPRLARELGIPDEARTAILHPVRTPDLEFLETLSENAGRAVRVFTDGQSALAWLKSD
jgi:hypothetical protein